MKILHAMIRTTNIDKSLDFYTNLIGLKKNRILKLDDCILHFLKDESGEFEIEITENFETPNNGYENGSAFGHFAFETDSMKEFDDKMKNLGYSYLYEPFMLEQANLKIAFVKDPDGNEIEIIEKVQD